MFADFIFSIFVVMFGALVTGGLYRKHAANLRDLMAWGFVAHVLVVPVQLGVTEFVYGGGDIYLYWERGAMAADLMRRDFSTFAPLMIRVFFHQEVPLPFEFYYGGPATAAHMSLGAYMMYFLGDSLFAASLVSSIAAFFGKLALFHAFKAGLAPARHRLVLAACVLLPSTLFWTGTILKESVVMAFMGFSALGIRWFIDGRNSVVCALMTFVPLVPIAFIKPYVVAPFAAGAAVWYYRERQGTAVGDAVVARPFYLALGVIFVAAGTILVGRLVPAMAVENLGQSAARIQESGSRVSGGSAYSLTENVDTSEERSTAQQLTLLPLALPTALFRPFFFEVRNGTMAVNALETSVILWVCVTIFRRTRFTALWKTVMSSPTLMFCLTFTVLFGTAVGVASTNMGALSRYRVPMMPFFITLLVMTWQQTATARRRPS